MFRKYECGCIGFETPGYPKKHVRSFYACDGRDERPNSLHRHDKLAEKESRLLTDDEVRELLDTVAALVEDGYALRELRDALHIAGIKVRS